MELRNVLIDAWHVGSKGFLATEYLIAWQVGLASLLPQTSHTQVHLRIVFPQRDMSGLLHRLFWVLAGNEELPVGSGESLPTLDQNHAGKTSSWSSFGFLSATPLCP